MKKGHFTLKFTVLLTMILGLLLSSHALAANRYRVYTEFFHLGELIAKPMMEVEEGETVAGEYSARGWGQYTITLLVRPAANGQVYVSLQFTSGNIEIQPNLLTEIGKPRSATIDKVQLNLLVELIAEDNRLVQGIYSYPVCPAADRLSLPVKTG